MNHPTGTVTFLFTDIEGSTKMAQEFNELLPDALKKHHSILKETVNSHNGFIFKIIGDAFCCAFQNADDAVKASVDAQKKLNSEEWNEAVIKVRMGIHSGNAEWSGTEYTGYITLARTNRIMSAAYGGQIIISNDAFQNKRENSSEDISFRDLGERRLKDLIQPVKLYQINSEGLQADFPPLKTLDVRPNNIPIQLSSFVGREEVMNQLKDLIRQSRLLTISGSGGSGKTRLAMQVGADIIDDFENGVYISELASVSDPAFILQTIINSLGIKEEAGKTLKDSVTGYLKDKKMLIIMDNCEHLINECADLAEHLLIKCPDLKIIATSREALNCRGELTFRLPSLTLPDISVNNTPEQLSVYESVRLFIERALAVNPLFRVNNENAPAVSGICNRLDGIPLAIELAAARIKILSVEKIYERLDDRFKLLTGGKRTALPRQQTLKALIDWSYNLLPANEKILWCRLSVFNSGWTIESAEEICSDDIIFKEDVFDLMNLLAEKSIIIYDDAKDRFRILETIKRYGEEKLRETEDADNFFLNHLNYYTKLSETAETKLNGEEVQNWLQVLESEHGNLQSAIEWSVLGNENEKGARLAGALGRFWDMRGYNSTGRRLIDIILENSAGVSKPVLGKTLNWAGNLAKFQGDYDVAEKFHEKSLSLRMEIGDERSIAESLNNIANTAFYKGDYGKAGKNYEVSLEYRRKIGDKNGIAASLSNLGNVAYFQKDLEKAQKFLNESLPLSREIGDKDAIANTLISLGNVAFEKQNFKQARIYYEECLALSRKLGNKRDIANALQNLGILSLDERKYDLSQKYYEESLSLRKEIGDKGPIAHSMNGLGSVALYKGDFLNAEILFEQSIEIFRKIKNKSGLGYTLNGLGYAAYSLGNNEKAQRSFEEGLILNRESGDDRAVAHSLTGLGNLASANGDQEKSKTFFEESSVLSRGKEWVAL